MDLFGRLRVRSFGGQAGTPLGSIPGTPYSAAFCFFQKTYVPSSKAYVPSSKAERTVDVVSLQDFHDVFSVFQDGNCVRENGKYVGLGR